MVRRPPPCRTASDGPDSDCNVTTRWGVPALSSMAINCTEAHVACININVFTPMYIVHLKRPWQFAKRYPPHDLLRAMPLCCALFVVLLGGLLWCRHLITCASDVCCIFIAIHCQLCSYVMYVFWKIPLRCRHVSDMCTFTVGWACVCLHSS